MVDKGDSDREEEASTHPNPHHLDIFSCFRKAFFERRSVEMPLGVEDQSLGLSQRRVADRSRGIVGSQQNGFLCREDSGEFL